MALEIRWTRRAQKGYDQIIEYLKTHFTEVEIRRFIQQTEEFFPYRASVFHL